MEGSVNITGSNGRSLSEEEVALLLDSRPFNPDLLPHPKLPDDTRLWAALQHASGGTWGGCVYDVGNILTALGKG